MPSAQLRQQVLATSPELSPVINEMPLGTSATSNPLIDNYTTSQVSEIREDTTSLRIDNNFGSKNSLFLRVNINDSHVFGPLFGVTPSALGLSDFQNVPVRTSNAAISNQHIFSPRFINQVLVGMQRWGSQIISNTPIPQTTVTGLTIVPGTRGRSLSNNTSYQAGDNVTYVRGRHTMRWGGTVYRVFINRRSIDSSNMQFTSIDDFINNTLATANYNVGDPGHSTRATQLGLYFNDTFQLRPGLTLDFGIRYDVATPPHDAYDATQVFDTRTDALAAPGTPYFKTNKRNFAPRLAFAWSATSKLVVRGGFGVFFQAYPVGFGAYSVPLNNIPGNTNLVRQQIPDLSYPFDRFISQGSKPLPTVAGFAWEKPDIYSNQWNLSVGYQITNNTGVLIAYVGNHGLNLRRNLNINFFDPALGRRPNTNFANINIETATGQNIYHAAQFSFIRRFSTGLQYSLAYSLAHAIDDVQDQGLYSAQPQDNNNWKAERGNSSGDIRHNVSFNILYDLPIGQGHRLFGSASPVLQQIVGGWRIATLGLFRSGIANTVYIGTNTFGNGNFGKIFNTFGRTIGIGTSRQIQFALKFNF